ncbi:MAG: hypothetical protein KatS3mg088_580 [Patescibacteria group bacterium]|nr:MAG: hypothetical protein KatS3mg088_580 [Patescibacteria group bacterium]
MPQPLPLKKLLGPSFILLGLGLGSGEVILWPYLTSKYGMGIIWGAVLGITLQFFLNMEIERYTLARGESVFVGLARKYKKIAPFWFIISTLLPWMWPGIIASSAKIISNLADFRYTGIVPSLMLISIGTIFTLGSIVYKTQEKLLKLVIGLSVPTIILITLFLLKKDELPNLAYGIIGRGDGYWFLPAGISIATFLSAFAYAGAGGNLNLAQSFYIKEKGYGMGKYSGRITSILTGKKEKINLEGFRFPLNPKNLSRFKLWWKRINIEHLVVFWLTGAFTMVTLSFLAYLTVGKQNSNYQGIEFLIYESKIIGSSLYPILGNLFLTICGVTLYFTQFSVIDATSRIMSENLILIKPDRFRVEDLPKFYYVFLWLQIILGVIIFSLGLTEPFILLVIGAVLNAFTMFIYSFLVFRLNNTSLEVPLRPNIFRNTMLLLAFLFYGVFGLVTIIQYFQK